MRRKSTTYWRATVTLFVLAAPLLPNSTASSQLDSTAAALRRPKTMLQLSGIYQFRNQAATSARQQPTDCPQAGVVDGEAPEDRVETISDDGDDGRINQDLSCFAQNETSIAINPRNQNNIVGGANDYRLGFGSSGFYASKDGGRTWRDGILPFPSLSNGDTLDGGGDPAVAFDRQGYVYYADINFNRTDDTNGVFVSRSSDGGYTWNRPCMPIDSTPANPNDNRGVCGGIGDPRSPGDGVVSFQFDNNTVFDDSVPFDDKEYIAVGPRPAGVAATCFGAFTRNPARCQAGTVGADRIYVTWTRFQAADNPFGFEANIYFSYSDDRGLSWSPPKAISGRAPFCLGFTASDTQCSSNQFSVPTVHPRTGILYVGFQNFNTPEENQYLVVRSTNGGQSFTNPRYVSSIFDFNYPQSGGLQPNDPPFPNRPDCEFRGQQDFRAVLTNSCFRVNSAGNIVVDKRGGSFADDLYVVISDNRNGTPRKSNTDIFLFKSTNGGDNWTLPTRVNNDVSRLAGLRDDLNNEQVEGNDQWFPWVDINTAGDLNIVFHDRRLDRDSREHEWSQISRQFPGNYLAWFWGAQCRVVSSDDCIVNSTLQPQPTAPVNPVPDWVPGQNQAMFPFRNFAISDVPSNMDYSFRSGIFMGDYNNVAVRGEVAYGFWTDARNGRASRRQLGRNPICEQADVWLDRYLASGATSDTGRKATDELFLRTRCP